jgi:hypothetical protein
MIVQWEWVARDKGVLRRHLTSRRSFFSLCNLDIICIVNYILAIVFLILTNNFNIESIMTLGRLNSLCIIVLKK